MCPVIKRVTHSVRNRFSPVKELILTRTLTCNELFIYTQCTHGAPLVMVAVYPYFGYVPEYRIISYLLWRQVIVIIYNRLILGIVMV